MTASNTSQITRTRVGLGILAGVVLVVLCTTTLNRPNDGTQTLEHAQALAKTGIENIPLSQVPWESEIETMGPEWELTSDQVIGEGFEEEEAEKADVVEEEQAGDDDVDSPVGLEYDQTGKAFIPLVEAGVLADETKGRQKDDENEMADEQISATSDGKKKQKKKKHLCNSVKKVCVKRRKCERSCDKKCFPVRTKPCTVKLHCRCWCKCGSKIMKKHKCIIFKKTKSCIKSWRYKCKTRCRKLCKYIPKCYCCHGPKLGIKKKCYRTCAKITFIKRRCGSKCRCMTRKCARTCEMYCK